MNRTGKIITSWTLLVGASTLSQCDWITEKDTKKNLVEVLEKEKKHNIEKDSTASFLVDQFAEKVNDNVEINDSCFVVKVSDLEWTPLFWKKRMIAPTYWNLLWYNQAETIINNYNKWHRLIKPTDWVSADETLNIPLIYPELKSYFPENWSEVITEFPEYRGIFESDLLFVARCDNWKSALAYYKNGKLKLATYVSLGNPKLKKAIATPSWIFTLIKDNIRRRSTSFWNSPMAYAIHILWAWNGWVYFHQWWLNWFDQSHWCWRSPWAQQKYLYEHLPKQSKCVLHDLYNPTLKKRHNSTVRKHYNSTLRKH